MNDDERKALLASGGMIEAPGEPTYTDLSALLAVADAATDGPWTYLYPRQCCPGVCIDPVIHNVERFAHANAKHVATFNPVTVRDLIVRLQAEQASKDRWRQRAKSAQNELSDIRTTIGSGPELWTEADSISVYRTRAEDAEAERDALRTSISELADEWDKPYGEFMGHPDDVARLRALLGGGKEAVEAANALRARLQEAEADRNFERQRCATLSKTADHYRARLAEVETERDEAVRQMGADRLSVIAKSSYVKDLQDDLDALRSSIQLLADEWGPQSDDGPVHMVIDCANAADALRSLLYDGKAER